MKRNLIVLLLLAMGACSLFAQNDTTKIIAPVQHPIPLIDNPLLEKDNDVLQPIHSDFDFDLTNPKVDTMTMQLGKLPKKNTFFNSTYSRFIIPVSLIGYGLLTRTNGPLQQLDHSTNHEVNEHLQVPIPIDDYSQFAPAAAVYLLDMTGIAKAKHNFRDRTIVMATSYLLMGITVQTMKKNIHVERPDGSNNKSFPSGHTATAFVGAQILFREYKSVPIAIAGYTVATATGVLRVLNKKHWVSDVAAGAGIGMLSAETGYLLLSVFQHILGVKHKDKSLVVVPLVNDNHYGVGLSYSF